MMVSRRARAFNAGGMAGRGSRDSRAKRDAALGVVGTPVLDRIFLYRPARRPAHESGRRARPAGERPVESLGGIFYSLQTLAALTPHPSFVLPVLGVGADAVAFIRAALAALCLDTRYLRVTRARQNSVELRYTSPAERRAEFLTGGVPPLSLSALRPMLLESDALYLNFVAGNELTLATMRRLRRDFAGPIYADLHSLVLGRAPNGLRFHRPVPDWREWVACFDVLQCNAEEAAVLWWSGKVPRRAGRFPPPLGARGAERLAAEVLTLGPRLFILTSGAGPLRAWPAEGRPWRHTPRAPGAPRDPTGCGDVLGAAFCAFRYQRGLPARTALARASRIAAWKATRIGSEGLAEEIPTRYLDGHG